MSLTQLARNMRVMAESPMGAGPTSGFDAAPPLANDFPMDFSDPMPPSVDPVVSNGVSVPPETHLVGSTVVQGRDKSVYSIVAALAGVSVTIGVLKLAPARFPHWFENRKTGKIDKTRVNVAGLLSGIVTYGIVLMAMNFRK